MAIAETRDAARVAGAPVDPITLEIVRHRLWSVADEMAMTLIRTAGSPSITEVNDFLVALFTADGEIALGGWGGNRHVSCTAQAVKGILARFAAEEIREDDVFLLNDPYVAAIHQQDVYLLSPVHFDGELVGWAGNFTHLPDIGGIDPGWSPRATDVRQEGLRVPGLKIVDRGVLRTDVWDTLLNMTREPEMNGLQLRAQLAANNSGKTKLRALLAKVGVEAYRAIVAQLIAQSEAALRARLRQLPDGTWRTREYLDTNDEVYTAELAMTKEGDALHFDFTGTSPQVANYINCTYWGTRGGVFVSVSSMLGYGLPWNEGLLRPLSLTVPEGTLLNCAFPAPVSAGTTAASRLATIASWTTIASMLAMSADYADELSALWSGGSAGGTASGRGRDGRYYVLQLLSTTGGGGARRFADGVDTCGGSSNPKISIPNIETLERNAPLLFLTRRQVPDSGGPGTYRGGVCAEVAWISHKAPEGVVEGELHGSGREPAMSRGLFGGLQGNTLFELRSGTRLREVLPLANPVELDALGGEVRLLPPQALLRVDATSVLLVRGDGGGGVGDPLRRAPAAVLADVEAGLVSTDQARRLYGVVLYAGAQAVDAAATARQRQALRAARLGRAPTAAAGDDGLDGASVRPPVRYDRAAGVARCATCAGALGPLAANWKDRAVERVEPLADLGPQMVSTRFVLRSYSCPACGALLDAEMTLAERPTGAHV